MESVSDGAGTRGNSVNVMSESTTADTGGDVNVMFGSGSISGSS